MDLGEGEETFGDLTLKIIREFSGYTDGFWLCTCGGQVLGSNTERFGIIKYLMFAEERTSNSIF